MNQSCPIHLVWEWLFFTGCTLLFFHPIWEWWLDPSQPAIDGLVLNWDDWAALLSMHGSKALWAVVHVRACSLSMHASFCEQQHICVTPSPVSLEFWVPSIITGAVLLTRRSACCRAAEQNGVPANKYSWFLPSHCYHNATESISVEKRIRDNKSGGCERWGNIWGVLERCAFIDMHLEIFACKMVKC